MKVFLVCILFLVSVFSFAQSSIIGEVETLRGPLIVTASATKGVMLSTSEAGFVLHGRELDVFKYVVDLNVQLSNAAESFPRIYKRTSGQISSSDLPYAKIIRFGFFSDGENTPTIGLSIIDRSRNLRSRMGFTADQFQELLDLLDEATEEVSNIQDQISQLNDIVSEALRYH